MGDQLTLAPWESASINWDDSTRIVSWNVNGIRAVAKKGFFDFVKNFSPSILCLQETKARREQCESEIQQMLGYYSYWHSAQKPGYSGVANFSKIKPLEIIDSIGIEKFDREGRVLLSRFEKFSVVNIYYPNGGSGDERQKYKMEFLREILPWFKRMEEKGHNLIILGDYNIGHKDIDVYDPIKLSKESGFLPEERKWLDQLEASGFIDTYRQFYPDKMNAYSWWAYFNADRTANRGWRIDMIWISKSLLPNLKSANIYPDIYGSDHCPVTIDLEF